MMVEWNTRLPRDEELEGRDGFLHGRFLVYAPWLDLYRINKFIRPKKNEKEFHHGYWEGWRPRKKGRVLYWMKLPDPPE